MSTSKPPTDPPEAANRPNPVSATINLSTTPQQAKPSTSPAPPTWPSQSPALGAQNGPSPGFSNFSAATAEILNRIRANPGHTGAGSPAYEAKRAEVLQSYVTSDKLPTPSPIASAGRKGRGGRVGTPSQLKTEVGATPASGATPTSGRGSGRGKGRARGRGGGRGGKRKRSESFGDSDDDSDISSSYTPLPTRTKSGRNVNKPVAFVPTLPEPSPQTKRRKSTKALLAAQCKVCHRGTGPGNNRIVFCDVCTTAYHQFCHDPPINNDVVNIVEKEWLCGPCERSKRNVVEGMEGLTAGEGLSIEEKRAYLSTLPQSRLVALLLHSTIRHPELPIFPPDVHKLIPENQPSIPPKPPTAKPQPPKPANTNTLAVQAAITSPPNGLHSTGHTPRSQNPATDGSEMDDAEAQLLGEISRSSTTTKKPNANTSSNNNNNNNSANNSNSNSNALDGGAPPVGDDLEEGYDTDPPAHYPKPGNGLARTLRPESEDLLWLVDNNYEVFSHSWKGDGSGVGPDGTPNGVGDV